MIYTKGKTRSALTLVEVILASVIAAIITLIVGGVLIAGHRNWLQSFYKANSGIEVDAYLTTITFGNTGRMSNKRDYCIYTVSSAGNFSPAGPEVHNPVSVVDGNAVEFRYWDVPLGDSLIDVTRTATAYRLIYLEDDRLMMDEGPYPPGGVDGSGNRTGWARRQQLAANVTALKFSHTSKAVVPPNQNLTPGDGCIRMFITFTDPNDNSTVTVTAATLMRNVWPYK